MRLLITNVNLDASTMTGCEAIAERLEALAPEAEIRHVHWADNEAARVIETWRPHALVLGPNGTPFPAYPSSFDDFLSWVRGYEDPLLGICGGHQVLALAHGATVGPVFDVPPASDSYVGMPKVSGDTRVTLDADHLLFAGLPATITVAASHVDEVQRVPAGFTAIASGAPCVIQAISRDDHAQVGVQFHPERTTETRHGETLLLNWLATFGS